MLVSIDDTVVLLCRGYSKKGQAGPGLFPLTVDCIEKTYAAGKIPGGGPSSAKAVLRRETLTSRLIDRPIRPLFPEWLLQRSPGDAAPSCR